MVWEVNERLKAVRYCRQHFLFYCLITPCFLPPSYVYYRCWGIPFLVLHCWIRTGCICCCIFCGAAYLIWELEMGINFKILEYLRASNRIRAMDNTYVKHAERAQAKSRQQGNFRHQRLYSNRQHNILPTSHKYKPTWSGDWGCRHWKTVAYWVALSEMVVHCE